MGVGMKALKFSLSGKTAFFKKPDVNSNVYFTYGHIHKLALMGIFGAIMGYGGYNQQVRDKDVVYPEFYEKLKDIRVSIVPEQAENKENSQYYAVSSKGKSRKGYFNKKIQTFNNTVGYANADGNLIVKEQWLENPCWDIYLMLRGELEEEISKRVLNSKTAYIPYLGKNDHMAVINKAEIVELKNPSLTQAFRIDSLYLKDCFKAYVNEEFAGMFDLTEDVETNFKYEERLPIALEEMTNQYITVPFIYTNSKLLINDNLAENIIIGCCHEKVIQFF